MKKDLKVVNLNNSTKERVKAVLDYVSKLSNEDIDEITVITRDSKNKLQGFQTSILDERLLIGVLDHTKTLASFNFIDLEED